MKFRFGEKRKNKIVKFDDIFSDLVEELNLTDSFYLERIISKWSLYVGNILASHSYPERIFKNILFIRVDHPIYANELSLYQKEVLSKIKDDIGKNIINAIRFEVKKSRWSKNK